MYGRGEVRTDLGYYFVHLMNVRALIKLLTPRDVRNIVVGVIVVFGALALAGMTLFARSQENVMLAGVAAGLSLIFVLLILIFVVPPLARNASREASQMNLPFEFTTGGAVMIGLTFIVGFSAWNTGNNLLFIVLSFMLSAMLVGFFAGRIVLKKLDVKMRFPESIYAGEPFPVTVSLTNRKRVFPAFSVVVDVRGRTRELVTHADELAAHLPAFIAERLSKAPVISRTLDHAVYVPHGSLHENTIDISFPERGRFTIKDFELSTAFPFGFIRHRRRLAAHEAEMMIFPQAAEYNEDLAPAPLSGANNLSQLRGTGGDLLSLRDYEPDDDLRRVDWKATARTDKLTVREFGADTEIRAAIIFDTFFPDDGSAADKRSLRERMQDDAPAVSERFEKGVSLAAAAIRSMAACNAEFRLISGDEDTGIGSGRGHLMTCLRLLAVAEPAKPAEQKDRNKRIPELIELIADGPVIYITAYPAAIDDPAAFRQLKIISF